MSEAEVVQDTIAQGTERAKPASWRGAAIAVVSLAIGAALGLTVARSTAGEAFSGDGGVVYVCNGKALVLVHASGLSNREIDVQFPLRGDGVLLPLPADGVEVLAGKVTGYQSYRPVDGQLAIARDVGVPPGDTVAARVGSRRVTVAVRRCGTP